jgi:hypothetical protein
MTEIQNPAPQVIAIWQTDFAARWLVPVASELDENDHWSGWTDVDADGRTGKVEVAGVEYTPAEAREFAKALGYAADHAERFGHNVATVLTQMTFGEAWPEIDHLPVETQRAVRDALRAASERYRKQQGSRMTTRTPTP